MRKRLFLLFCLTLLASAVRLMAQTAVTVQDCEPGTLWDRIEAQGVNVETVTSLTVSGSLDGSDFRFIRRMLTSLEDIDLSGTNMDQVEGEAFNGCSHLKTCRLPLSVTTINCSSFRDCTQLQSIVFGDATAIPGTFLFHANMWTICGDAFSGCRSVTCADFSACTSINNIEGFNENCRKLTTVVLPQEGNYYIGGHAFCGTSIETLTLPTAVDHVDWHFIPSTMRTLVLKSKEPIGAADDAFDEVSHSNLRIMVPAGSLRKYLMADAQVWYNWRDCLSEYNATVSIMGEGKLLNGSETLSNGSLALFVANGTVTAQPATGYYLQSACLNETPLAVSDNIISLPSEITEGTLTVTFARIPCTLTVQVEGNGQVLWNGTEVTASLSFEYGQMASFTLVPAEGETVQSIVFNGEPSVVQNGGLTYTTPRITSDATLTVTFGQMDIDNTVELLVQTNEGGYLEYKGVRLEATSVIRLPRNSTPMLIIVNEATMCIGSVILNDYNITSLVKNRRLTLPALTADSRLDVTFASSTELEINNPDGGTLADQLEALNINMKLVSKLKVIGTMTVEDWTAIRNQLTSLRELDLTETDLTEIPGDAMKQHASINRVALPATLKRIGNGAFDVCSQLFKFTGYENITEIGDNAFASCACLNMLPFSDKIEYIGFNSFGGCSSIVLDELVFPASLRSIGGAAFYSGPQFKSVDMSRCNYVGELTYYVFSGSFRSFKLPQQGNYSISYHALQDVWVDELVIPACVTEISYNDVFGGNLKKLYVQSQTPILVGNDSFNGIDFSTCELYVPTGCLADYQNANMWSKFENIKEAGLNISIDSHGRLKVGNRMMVDQAYLFPMGDESITFEALPDEGYYLEAIWLNGEELTVENGHFTISAEEANGMLTVAFTPVQYDLTLHISGDGQLLYEGVPCTDGQVIRVDNGSAYQFALQPAEGKVVQSISFNGEESALQNGATTYVTPTISGDAVLSVNFGDPIPVTDMATFTVTTGTNGIVEYTNTTLLPQTTIDVKLGQDAVFTIKPNNWYVIAEVLLNGNNVTNQVDANGKLTIANVDADATLSVTFSLTTEITIDMLPGNPLANMLNAELKQNVTKITISGPITTEDFYTMRDDMPLLADIDLWEAECDWIPDGAFCIIQDGDNETGKLSLQRIRLPQHLKIIGYCAFAGCSNLKEVNFTELEELESISGRAFNSTGLTNVDLSNTRITNMDDLQFRRSPNLETIVLPNTITYLGNSFQELPIKEIDLSNCVRLKEIRDAFWGCRQLQRVVLPDNLQTTEGTFSECNALTTVNFPLSLRTLGSNTFNNTQITSANLHELNNLRRIGGSTFNGTKLSSVTLPESLETMGDAFHECHSLTTIDMSQTQLTTITGWTFSGCTALENVQLPQNLMTIGAYAFERTALSGVVELPATLTNIGEGAFHETSFAVVRSLATIPPVIENWAFTGSVVAVFVPEGAASAYKEAPIWEDLTIMDKDVYVDVTVTTEGNLAIDIMEQAGVAPGLVTHLKVHGPLNATDFAVMRSNMTMLYDLDLSDAQVDIIPERAFLDKKVLMDVVLPEQLLIIQEGVFQGCSALRGTLTLPQGLTTIGNSAFQGCSSLKGVVFNDALEVIRSYAFEGCVSLEQEVTFPAPLLSIGEYAFANCRKLYGTVTFNPEFYLFIGAEGYWSSTGRAFQNCSGIETVDLSACEYLTELPEGTFEGCTSLQTVMLPPYTERIYSVAFNGCHSLTDISFPSTMLMINSYAFNECTSLKSVNLSDCPDFGTIEEYAFSGCSKLETVSMPNSLNWIGSYAFNECRKLANLNVEALQPADLGDYVFRRVNTEKCVLSIPTGAYYDYLVAAQWGAFVQMRKSIDVTLDEGASLSYASSAVANDENTPAGARGMRRAPAAASQQGDAKVKDGTSLYVKEDESVTFYITPDENVSIRQVLFNDEDVTTQLINGAYETPQVTEASSFKVLLNVDGPITVKELRMTETEVAIQVAESYQIAAAVYPNNATNKTIVWTSSDEEVARVSANGTVTGVSAGRATITARTEDGDFEKTCQIIIMSNDYYITMNNVKTFVDNVVMLPVTLHNADNASAIQFDVYLPDGLGMDNEGNGDYGVCMSERGNDHTVSAARRSDGSVRVVVYSNNDFTDNDGVLLFLPITTRENEGEFEVKVKNIHITGPKSFDFIAPDYTTLVTVSDYPLGDSNGNGEITITDVVNTVEEILEHNPERFIRRAADANRDGFITVSDVTATVGIMLGWDGTAGSRMASPATMTKPVFSADDATMTAGGQQSLAMRLSPASNFAALQCDVFLPDGFTIDLDNITSTVPTHIICADKVASGAVRILMISMSNEVMQDADKEILKLHLQAAADMELGTYTIDIRNIHLVASDGTTEQIIPDAKTSITVSEATAIGQQFMALGAKVHTDGHFLFVEAQKAGTLRLVSTNGVVRVLQLQPGNNKFFVEAGGIYILEGKKVIIK